MSDAKNEHVPCVEITPCGISCERVIRKTESFETKCRGNKKALEMAMKTVWIVLLCLFVIAQADQGGFDVRHHLSTVTRFLHFRSHYTLSDFFQSLLRN